MKAWIDRSLRTDRVFNTTFKHYRVYPDDDGSPTSDAPEMVHILTNDDLRTHNEKIARAALETGFAQGYSREGFGSKQEYDEYVEMKLSAFLQSPEYKELVGDI